MALGDLLLCHSVRCQRWVLWGLCCGGGTFPHGKVSLAGSIVTLGGCQPCWWPVLEMGDVSEGTRWLSHRAELLQPSKGVSRRVSPPGLVSCHIRARPLSLPSARRHRLRVPHLHPAGGHDLSEVGGAGGAQRPHHAVRGRSRTAGAPTGTRGDTRGFQQGELGQLLLRLMGVKGGCSVAAAPEPLAWGRDPACAQPPARGSVPAGESCFRGHQCYPAGAFLMNLCF